MSRTAVLPDPWAARRLQASLLQPTYHIKSQIAYGIEKVSNTEKYIHTEVA